MYELALSRFVSALAIYIASGLNTDEAMGASLSTITHERLHENVASAHKLMLDVRIRAVSFRRSARLNCSTLSMCACLPLLHVQVA